jgi:hypothetical protein
MPRMLRIQCHGAVYTLLIMLVVCHAPAGGATTNEWGPITNNAQMAINVTSPWSRSFRVDATNSVRSPYTVKRDLKASAHFSLLVRVRNLSTNETLNFDNSRPPNTDMEHGLACVVISPSGKDVSPDYTIAEGSFHTATAAPNRTIEFEFPLSQLCKLEEVGTYRITARKKTAAYSRAQQALVLTSNTLSISVVP